MFDPEIYDRLLVSRGEALSRLAALEDRLHRLDEHEPGDAAAWLDDLHREFAECFEDPAAYDAFVHEAHFDHVIVAGQGRKLRGWSKGRTILYLQKIHARIGAAG